MNRRDFITLLGGVAAWPCVAAAESAKKPPVVGMLVQGTPAQVKGMRLRDEIEATAPKLDIKIVSADVQKPEDVELEQIPVEFTYNLRA